MTTITHIRDELRPEFELACSCREPLHAGDSLIVYGAGRGGHQFLDLARQFRLKVLFVCDDNPALHSGTLDGIPLRPPAAIRNHLDVPVVIALAQFQTVVARLKQWGVRRRLFSDDFQSHVDSPSFQYVRPYFDSDQIATAWDKIENLNRLLVDEHSRLTLRNLLRYRLSRSLEHAVECPYGQYRHPLVQAKAGDVVIDGGAWTGDTAVPFAQAVGKSGQIYAFEPAPSTFKILQETIGRSGLTEVITPVNLGLGLKEGECRFAFANAKFGSSSANAAGELVIRITSLDHLCSSRNIRPNLVKMDIEGAELDAIEGARQTLLTARPKLQICIYHSPSDLWEIPLRLHELCPWYRFYLGHHERELAETVIYAICPENS